MSTLAGVIVTSVNAVLLVALTVWVLRAKTWKKLTLNTSIESKAVESSSVMVGDKGKALTRLAPMGTARFGEHVVEVKALEGMIDAGSDIHVILIEDNRIYVETVGVEF